jgi:hypothetical protein
MKNVRRFTSNAMVFIQAYRYFCYQNAIPDRDRIETIMTLTTTYFSLHNLVFTTVVLDPHGIFLRIRDT